MNNSGSPLGVQVVPAGETRAGTLAVARAVGALAEGSYGPYGACKIVRANERAGASLVSAVGGRIFESLRVEHPVGQLIVAGTAAAQHSSHGRERGGVVMTIIPEDRARLFSFRLS